MDILGKKWHWWQLGALVTGVILVLFLAGTLMQLPHLRAESQRAHQQAALMEISHHTYGDLLARARHTVITLADAPCVSDLLLGLPARVERPLGHTLEIVKQMTDAEIAYVMDTNGVVVASTSYGPDGATLLGSRFAFRPYFQRALAGAPTIDAAVGAQTGARGIYFSAPVYGEAETPYGVVVLKVGLEAIDDAMRTQHLVLLMVDADGVVFGGNRPSWRFQSLVPLTASQQEALLVSQRYGSRTVEPLPHDLSAARVTLDGVAHHVARIAGPLSDWQLISLMPVDDAYPLSQRQGMLIHMVGGTVLVVALLLLALIVNIALRKRVERRYRLVVENATEAMVVIQNGEIKFFIDRLSVLTGYSHDELVASLLQTIFHPDDRARIKAIHQQRMQSGDAPVQYEVRLQHRDGTPIWVLVNAVRLEWEGRPATLALMVDVTERRKLMERFAHTARMEAIGQLAGGIAHDFNNLLVGILGGADILRHDFPPHSPQAATLELIRRSARRASELTQQLLGFARRGRQRNEQADLHSVINETVSLLSRTLGKSIAIVVSLSAKNSVVMGDAGQLKQVIVNLALNARDAMPEGGEVTIMTHDLILQQSLDMTEELPPGRYVELVVRDNGAGIEADKLPRIFEPFFTTKPVGKGTGMGLAMIYGIVEEHGGRISVESTPGEGSAFSVLLPIADETRLPQAPLDPSATLYLPKSHIMIVDDEDVVRSVTDSILTGRGCNVLTFESAKSALKYFRDNSAVVDLVLLDVEMPEMDGLQCHLAMLEIDPEVNVLVTTGYTQSEKVARMVQAGALALLRKPYSSNDLLRHVAAAIAKARERQQPAPNA
jgi:PAS domain S-box-containing protein